MITFNHSSLFQQASLEKGDFHIFQDSTIPIWCEWIIPKWSGWIISIQIPINLDNSCICSNRYRYASIILNARYWPNPDIFQVRVGCSRTVIMQQSPKLRPSPHPSDFKSIQIIFLKEAVIVVYIFFSVSEEHKPFYLSITGQVTTVKT